MKNESSALVTRDQANSLIVSAAGLMDFSSATEVVNWSEVAEVIDPRGEAIPVRQLAGQGLTIMKLKPFSSTISGTEEVVYWAVCRLDDGKIINTVLGSQAIIDEIGRIAWVNIQYQEAKLNGDETAMAQWQAVGANRLPRIILEWHPGKGRYSGYYTVQRTIN